MISVRVLYSAGLSLSLASSVWGCTRTDSGSEGAAASDAASPSSVPSTVQATDTIGRSGRSALVPPALGLLVDSLGLIEGSFVRNAPSSLSFTFTGDSTLFMRIGKYGDEAVDALVGCMDRQNSSRVLLAGDPVPIGALCGVALDYVAYHEATDALGDLVGDWPGWVDPASTAEQLRAAKKAWLPLVKSRNYVLRPTEP